MPDVRSLSRLSIEWYKYVCVFSPFVIWKDDGSKCNKKTAFSHMVKFLVSVNKVL